MMVLFTLPRLKYLLPSLLPSVLSPGDWYYFHEGIPFVALMIHLACVLPLSLLMILQFTPRIRQGHLLLHRINGYICIVLSLVGNLTALILARRAFGGNIASQTVTGLLAIMSTTGLAMAWWNIRRLQIEQHRAWMLRSMYWMGSIVSTRFIMPFAALVQTYMGGYYEAWSCAEIEFTLGGRNKTLDLYPQCGLLNGTTDGWVAVKGELDFGKPIGVGAVFDSNFGMGVGLLFLLGMTRDTDMVRHSSGLPSSSMLLVSKSILLLHPWKRKDYDASVIRNRWRLDIKTLETGERQCRNGETHWNGITPR